MSMVIDENGSEVTFQLGDLVFAKVKGYQHWPATIRQLPGDEKPGFYCVSFFGSDDIGYVKAAQMVMYDNASAILYGIAKVKNKMTKPSQAKYLTAMQEIEQARKTSTSKVPNGKSKAAEPDENGINGEVETNTPTEAKGSRKRRISKSEAEEKTPKIEASAKRRKDDAPVLPTPPARRRGRPAKKSIVNEELPQETQVEDETLNGNSEKQPVPAENSEKDDTVDSSTPAAPIVGSIRNRSARRVSIPKKFSDGNTLLYEPVPTRATLPPSDTVNNTATVVAKVENESDLSATSSLPVSKEHAPEMDTSVPAQEISGRKRRFLSSAASAAKKFSPAMARYSARRNADNESVALQNGEVKADETEKTELNSVPVAKIVKEYIEKKPDEDVATAMLDNAEQLKTPTPIETEPDVEKELEEEIMVNGDKAQPDEKPDDKLEDKPDTQLSTAPLVSDEIQPAKEEETGTGITLVPNNNDLPGTAAEVALVQKTDDKDTDDDCDLPKDEEPLSPADVDMIERNETVSSQDEDATAPRRSRLARNIEPPMRYKDTVDTVTLKPVGIKPGRKSTNLKEEPVAVNARLQDIKPQPFSSIKAQSSPRIRVNRDKSSMEIDELDQIEDNQQESEARERIVSLRTSQMVMECIIKLIEATSVQHQDYDIALEMLAKVSEKNTVTKDMLKSYPEIVEVIRKIQHFVGNPNIRMSKQQKIDMPTKTSKIRDAAKKALDSFKELMTTNSKPYAVLLMEQQRKQWSNEQV